MLYPICWIQSEGFYLFWNYHSYGSALSTLTVANRRRASSYDFIDKLKTIEADLYVKIGRGCFFCKWGDCSCEDSMHIGDSHTIISNGDACFNCWSKSPTKLSGCDDTSSTLNNQGIIMDWSRKFIKT